MQMATVEAGKSLASLRARERGRGEVNGVLWQCGRVRAMLRRALACPGHTRRGAGDARPLLATTRRATTDAGRPPSLIQLIQKLKGTYDSRFSC